jgi:hypothetical protein
MIEYTLPLVIIKLIIITIIYTRINIIIITWWIVYSKDY